MTNSNGSPEFRKKSAGLQKLINQALFMIDGFGIPVGLSPRRTERMALCLMALCGVTKPGAWKNAKSIEDGVKMKSRDIISFMNRYYGENVSPGSYDDIRRRDLKFLVLSGVVVRTKPGSARNDPGRGYAISKEHVKLIREFGKSGWEAKARKLVKTGAPLRERLAQKREISMVPARLPDGSRILLSPGEHNKLQKQIVEQFIPRFAPGARILYIGDTSDKFLLKDEKMLRSLRFFELEHGELPDIIAYRKDKNWLYLIEAVHSFGPISPTRLIELRELAKNCKAPIIYVTAFLDYKTFHKFAHEIAWETEAWIAEKPDHLIHYNGHKFLGPYSTKSRKK